MITLENNPAIYDPGSEYCITLAATRSTLVDTDIYSRFIYSCENNFRRLNFYKGYKSFLMNMGLNRDQNMSLTSFCSQVMQKSHLQSQEEF